MVKSRKNFIEKSRKILNLIEKSKKKIIEKSRKF